ncbi:MAG: DNA alkylation repair protein [Candidatus Colwellbacteria bacterium]|jgi:3-methyladenine DNA glycosylase AlkD|nr:DNA alkylation repair protein [Candidatus Colwellbacteria bacterium]MCK9497329.1 DNA alkylation repair protein [Candidatus Colwellbacteria bacterium]MDD3752329.1 DNA alkylation repair protein [Candidatus Colwellbacteria bacterium]MDD4818603.1 DNA alkylation repair protein [Candidatus Colwellbacteria bacterium]
MERIINMPSLDYKKVKKDLLSLSEKKRAKGLERFFKTGKGEYGEGDKFLGITVPEQRRVAKKYFKEIGLDVIKELLNDGFHEARLTALIILVEKFLSSKEEEKGKIFRFYLNHTDRINNWDLVDASAPKIIGDWLEDKDKKVLYRLAGSKNLWERRIAIVSTFRFIDKGELDDAFSISKKLLDDREDLIHKAVGWALRECGKKDKKRLVKFINENGSKMSRTTLRYAIEKFPEKERKKILNETKK